MYGLVLSDGRSLEPAPDYSDHFLKGSGFGHLLSLYGVCPNHYGVSEVLVCHPTLDGVPGCRSAQIRQIFLGA